MLLAWAQHLYESSLKKNLKFKIRMPSFYTPTIVFVHEIQLSTFIQRNIT